MIDLGNERDVADYVLRAHRGPRSSASARVDGGGGGGGYKTASSEVSSAAEDEAEAEAEDVVSLAEDYVGRNNRKGQKRAVRLDEIGPRMEIQLVKITEGVPGSGGVVIYHEFVKKTKSEIAAQRASHAAKDMLGKERREEQEQNVQRKKALAEKSRRMLLVLSDEGDDDDGEASWDEGEKVSEGEVSEDEDARSEDLSSDSDEDEDEPEDKKPPRKEAKMK